MEYGGGLVEDCGGFGTMVGGETDMIEELLVEGCWVEASENNLMMMHHDDHMSGTTPQPHYIPMGDNDEESGNFVVGKRWWIGPQANPGPSTSVKERLVLAVGYLKEYTKNSNSNSNSNSNVLIQIWVPLRRRSGLFHNQYHNPNPVHESLPISVPNSNVQVRFFRSHEYPRVQAHHGSLLALPVFERGTATCLGVIEFLIANQNLINYRPQLDHLSNALEAVDFTSNQNMIPPAVKVFEELYEAAVNEIVQVLASVCKTHNLPLALTWAPCIQQEGGGRGKGGCSNSNSNSNSNGSNNNNMMMSCVSTVDSACYIGDVDVLGFQEACSEYHLYNGQGIVGTAFTTTKPCFAIDITAFSKAEYPLAHHANMFGLHAAVAIPLRSVYTGSAADFVLEFFLPKDCLDTHQQKHMLNSLSLVVQQACRSLHLHVVMEDDHNHNHHHLHHHHQHQHQHEEDQFTFPTTNIYMPSVDVAAAATPVVVLSQVEADASASASACSTKETTSSSCSWIAHMMEAQHKGKGVSVSLEYLQEPKEEFKVTTCNWEREREREGNSVFSEFGQVLQQQQQQQQLEHQSMSNSRASTVVSVEGGEESGGGGGSGGGGRRSSCSSNGRKSGDKRRTKAEKTISLPVLRQYFAGSLKDAAKSIGVCPTTLKRICRQHGITRWPSRKIKKVGHSLKKLQLVIDSVQGAEGAIQIGSFYASFPELSSATGHSDQSSMKLMHNHAVSDHHNSFYGDGGVTTSNLKSPPSACSQTVGNQTNSTLINNNNNNVVLTESNIALASTDHAHAHAHAAALMQIRRTHSEAELIHQHTSNIDIQDYQLHDQDTKQLLLHFNKSQTLPPRPSSTTTTTTTNNNNNNGYNNSLERGAFRVKATFADEKIRFSLQGMWCFRDLQVEIARRFNLNDMNNLVVKYLDDEGEWVVLACDGDLEECKDLHTSSHTRTIRLSLFQASPLNLHPNTFRNTSSSPPSSS